MKATSVGRIQFVVARSGRFGFRWDRTFLPGFNVLFGRYFLSVYLLGRR